MEVPPLHPGLASLELLLLQAEHRSSHRWEGQLLAQMFRATRVDDMWDFLRAHHLHPRIVIRLQDKCFYRIVEIGRLQLDWSLITAPIERWRPETHAFHLPIGEATITLQDVEVLYGLPIDGHPVALANAIREYTGLQYLEMLKRLTGFQPPDKAALIGASRLQLTPVREHLEAMHADITDDTTELHIHRWGAAVLGYLYRQMCRSSIGTQRDVAGFLPLLQFIWRTYNDELIAGLPDYCSTGRIMWSSSIPLICLDNVEHYATERVLRQFGRTQLLPPLPAWHMTYYQRDDRCRMDQTYVAWLEAQIDTWDQRHDLISPPPPDRPDGEHEYMGWYRSVTRHFVRNPVYRAGGYWPTFVPPVGTADAATYR
ncbi:serine/threonine-protein phosphatase 7 long form homolog [Nicotiana tomentosiformis]|uniref:serine/threonine-protein phosphatase 7 long form homolog n=1 Tax=Nicotiana tomentosiformis TaxID=4098 RepID=UPI00388C9E37